MEQMQDPSVRGGPDQQDGPGEEGVSGGAIPAPFPRPPVPRRISSVQVIAVCVCVGGELWTAFCPFQLFWRPVPLKGEEDTPVLAMSGRGAMC